MLFCPGALEQERARAFSSLLRVGRRVADDEGKVELQGEILEAFRGGMYRIALDNGHETLGYVSGKMRRYRIRINPGDRVTVELSPYDLTRGRITFRQR
jgi:translation initiation factor IF-1